MFEQKVKMAVKAWQVLRAFDGGNKLTAEGFKRACGISEERLDQVEKIITAPGNDAGLAVVRTLAGMVRERTISCVPPGDRLAMIMRQTNEEGRTLLASLSIIDMEVFALAVRWTAEKHPDAFGQLEDWDAHITAEIAARQAYQKALDGLVGAFSAADLCIDPDSVTRDEKARGLCRVGFQLASEISLVDGWPAKLVEAVGTARHAKAA